MKDFELTVLFRPDLDDFESVLNMVKLIITNHGGEIVKEENNGKKRLSHRIDGYDYTIRCFFGLKLPDDASDKISCILNIKEEILSYVLIWFDHQNKKAYLANLPNTNTPKETRNI